MLIIVLFNGYLAGTGILTLDLLTQIIGLGHQPSLQHFASLWGFKLVGTDLWVASGIEQTVAAIAGQSQTRPQVVYI